MRDLLAEGCGYEAYREGRFFSCLPSLEESLEQCASEAAGSTDEGATLIERIDVRRLFKQVTELFASEAQLHYASGVWCDRTTGAAMISSAPALAEIFPDAFFVFVKRRGIDNVMSKLRRFDISFDEACTAWAADMNAWLSVKDRIAGRYFEIDHYDLQKNPRAVIETLLDRLQLPASPFMPKALKLVAERRGETTSLDPLRRHSLSETGWTSDQRSRFVAHCGAAMEAFGYPLELENPGGVCADRMPRPAVAVQVHNLLNCHCRIPPFLMQSNFVVHPNLPQEPVLGVEFFSVNKGNFLEFLCEACVDKKNTCGVILEVFVRESKTDNLDWTKSSFFLAAGQNKLKVPLPLVPEIVMRFEVSLPEHADSNNFCGVSILNMTFR